MAMKDVESIAPYPLPEPLMVMKPRALDLQRENHRARLQELYKSPRYIAEEKIDGHHFTCVEGRFFSTRVSDKTGRLVEKTDRVPHLHSALLKLAMPKLILDGEIYFPGWKSSDLTTVMNCNAEMAIKRQASDGTWVRYKVFDILRDPAGNWLFEVPWKVRREILESLKDTIESLSYLGEAKANTIEIVDVVRARKEQYLESLLEQGLEGIVLKDVNGLYYPGKRPAWNWVKLKAELDDDVVIMGYEPATRIYTGKLTDGSLDAWPHWEGEVPVTRYWANRWIGAIVIGKYNEQGKLVRVGAVSGFDDQLRERLSTEGDRYVGRVIKIKAMERSSDYLYRHPRFLGFHDDKNARDCTLAT